MIEEECSGILYRKKLIDLALNHQNTEYLNLWRLVIHLMKTEDVTKRCNKVPSNTNKSQKQVAN